MADKTRTPSIVHLPSAGDPIRELREHQLRVVNWTGKWQHFPTFKIWQGVAICLGIDPDAVRPQYDGLVDVLIFDEGKRFAVFLDIAKANANKPGGFTAKAISCDAADWDVTASEFISWARSIGYTVPIHGRALTLSAKESAQQLTEPGPRAPLPTPTAAAETKSAVSTNVTPVSPPLSQAARSEQEVEAIPDLRSWATQWKTDHNGEPPTLDQCVEHYPGNLSRDKLREERRNLPPDLRRGRGDRPPKTGVK